MLTLFRSAGQQLGQADIKSFQEECARLAQLQTFDPAAFLPDKDTPQELCDFVLSLALAYNDIRDTTYVYFLLKDSRPEGSFRKSRIWGTWSGMNSRLFRLFVSHIYELLKQINEHKKVLEHPLFINVIKQLPSNRRVAWQTLVKAAFNATPKDENGKILFMIRNKIAFHYDQKCIAKGYAEFFLDPKIPDNRAFISRGNSMRQTRFYFIDAAVSGYIRSLSNEEITVLGRRIFDYIDTLGLALHGIIDGFIQKRGFAYRDFRE